MEKALGARKRHILLQFLAEALVITGVGGLAGVVSFFPSSASVSAASPSQRHAPRHPRCRRYPPVDLASVVIVATTIAIAVGMISGNGPSHPGRKSRSHRSPAGTIAPNPSPQLSLFRRTLKSPLGREPRRRTFCSERQQVTRIAIEGFRRLQSHRYPVNGPQHAFDLDDNG